MVELSNTHKNVAGKTQIPEQKDWEGALVIDHLVSALGGDPSCPLRRALVLNDIDEHPDTTQAEIMNRLEINKSALNRDIEWLYDYGCILRQQSENDARVIKLQTCGYAKKNLTHSLDSFKKSHQNLKKFLLTFINAFPDRKITLRDIKILFVLDDKKETSRQALLNSLYNGPLTTDVRALKNMMADGLVEEVEHNDEYS